MAEGVECLLAIRYSAVLELSVKYIYLCLLVGFVCVCFLEFFIESVYLFLC